MASEMRIRDGSSDVCSSDLFQGVIPSYTPHGQADLFKPYAQSESVYSTHRLDKLATGAPFEPSRTGTQGHTLVLSMPLAETFDVKYIGAYRRMHDDQYADLGGGGGSSGVGVEKTADDGPARTSPGGPRENGTAAE